MEGGRDGFKKVTEMLASELWDHGDLGPSSACYLCDLGLITCNTFEPVFSPF